MPPCFDFRRGIVVPKMLEGIGQVYESQRKCWICRESLGKSTVLKETQKENMKTSGLSSLENVAPTDRNVGPTLVHPVRNPRCVSFRTQPLEKS